MHSGALHFAASSAPFSHPPYRFVHPPQNSEPHWKRSRRDCWSFSRGILVAGITAFFSLVRLWSQIALVLMA